MKNKSVIVTTRHILSRIAYCCWYEPIGKLIYSLWKKPKVETLEETMKRLVDEKVSICRYGDGEFCVAKGGSIGFQKSSELLSKRLNEVLCSNEPNILVGIPDVFGDLNIFSDTARTYWQEYLYRNAWKLRSLLSSSRKYSNSFITRFATDYQQDWSDVLIPFYRKLFKDRDIYIVEGNQTRIGIGNNLLRGAASIKRILAPSENAFCLYDEILRCCEKMIPKDALVVIALGPTATVLAFDLAKMGYQALDLGHFGEQYEYHIREIDCKEVISDDNDSEDVINSQTICEIVD